MVINYNKVKTKSKYFRYKFWTFPISLYRVLYLWKRLLSSEKGHNRPTLVTVIFLLFIWYSNPDKLHQTWSVGLQVSPHCQKTQLLEDRGLILVLQIAAPRTLLLQAFIHTFYWFMKFYFLCYKMIIFNFWKVKFKVIYCGSRSPLLQTWNIKKVTPITLSQNPNSWKDASQMLGMFQGHSKVISPLSQRL